MISFCNGPCVPDVGGTFRGRLPLPANVPSHLATTNLHHESDSSAGNHPSRRSDDASYEIVLLAGSRHYSLPTAPEATVREVKNKAAGRFGLPENRIELVWAQTVLDSERTLGSYGIKHNDGIRVLFDFQV